MSHLGWLIAAVSVYLIGAAIISWAAGRFSDPSGDDEVLPWFIIFWPLVLPFGLLLLPILACMALFDLGRRARK